jgi:hypothetical protein
MVERIIGVCIVLTLISSGACSSSVDVRDTPPKATTTQTAPPPGPAEGGSIPTGVLAHWPFDEGPGQTAKDASKGHHGTVRGAGRVKGHEGGALRFSGQQTFVEVPHRPALNPAGPFEVSLWVSIEEPPLGYATLIEKGAGYGCSFRLLLLKNGHIRAALGNKHETVESPTAPSLNQWHKVEMIYTGRELQLKIDGLEAAKKDITSPALSSEFEVVIGRGLTGKIDEVKIVARSPKASSS